MLSALFGVLIVSPSAQASGYVLTLQQVGSDVVATGSGSIDLTGLSVPGTVTVSAAMQPNAGLIITGPASFPDVARYTGFTGPASFGSGDYTHASSGSGPTVGVYSQVGYPAVPAGYVSETPLLNDSSTWSNETFALLGVTPGVYEWTWGGGTGDRNFTLDIVGVPEPSTWCAGALLAGGLFSHFVRRRRSPSA